MFMTAFAYEIRKEQVDWHRGVLKDQPPGYHNGNPYDHALPRLAWELNVMRRWAKSRLRTDNNKSVRYWDE